MPVRRCSATGSRRSEALVARLEPFVQLLPRVVRRQSVRWIESGHDVAPRFCVLIIAVLDLQSQPGAAFTEETGRVESGEHPNTDLTYASHIGVERFVVLVRGLPQGELLGRVDERQPVDAFVRVLLQQAVSCLDGGRPQGVLDGRVVPGHLGAYREATGPKSGG